MRTTQSYSAVIDADEQRARLTPVQDVFTDDGVWAGRLVFRGELNAWTGSDSAHRLPLTRGTLAGARRLLLERVACRTRAEARLKR